MPRTPFIDGAFDFWTLYDNGEWEPETKKVLARFLSPGDLFLDVGAWIGPTALWACELGAHVIALEPDPVARANLRKNVKGLPVEIRPVALAFRNGYGFLDNPREFGDSMSRLSNVGHKVRTVRPDRLLEGIEPALLKLDIEGGEMTVLSELAPLCRERGIPMYVSFHSDGGRPEWFDGFELEGAMNAWSQLLAIPIKDSDGSLG